MTTEQLVAVVVAVLGAGGVGVIREWLKDRARAPIDHNAASMALSRSAGEQSLALVEQLQEERIQDRAAVARIRSEVTQLTLRLDGWMAWYHGTLVARWEQVRREPYPPDPPMTVRAVVDGDGEA